MCGKEIGTDGIKEHAENQFSLVLIGERKDRDGVYTTPSNCAVVFQVGTTLHSFDMSSIDNDPVPESSVVFSKASMTLNEGTADSKVGLSLGKGPTDSVTIALDLSHVSGDTSTVSIKPTSVTFTA